MEKVLFISALFLLLLKPLSAFTADKVVIIPLVKNGATGNAEATDVLEGKTFSNADNVNLSGKMTNVGVVIFEPGTSIKTIPEGYHNGSGIINGDTDLVSDNIKSGVSIFGISGNYTGPSPYRGALQGCRWITNNWGWTITDCNNDCELYSQLNAKYDTNNLIQTEANIAADHCKNYCTAISTHLGLLHEYYPDDGFMRAYDYLVELCEIYNH